MTALSTKLDTSAVEELIPTEMIGDFIAGYEYTAPSGLAVAWAKPGKGSIVHRFPRWNQLDGGSGVPSGTKTETDVFTDVTLDTTESSITPGFVGFRLPISDESSAEVQSGSAVPVGAVLEAVRGLNDRMDSDILSSITSATNTVGAATDNFTAAKFRAAAAQARTLELTDFGMGVACILHHDGFRDLEESIGGTTAPFTASNADASLFGAPRPGAYRGSYMGFKMFESGNIPANASNWAGCMTPCGAGASGLGIVITEGAKVVPTRGDDAENRKVTYYVVSAWYGAGISNPSRILEILHRT